MSFDFDPWGKEATAPAVVTMSTVAPERVAYLWPGRLPLAS